MITDFRDHLGEIRKLGRREPDSRALQMRAAMTNIQAYRTANGLPALVPAAEWVPVDNREIYDTRFVLNQGQYGACVGFSDACAEMKARFAGSGDLQIFSGAFVYALVNGGSDNGAIITDAMQVSLTTGNVLKSQFDLQNLVFSGRPQKIPDALLSAAAQYRAGFCMTVGTWDEVCTAIQMGCPAVQLPIQVGNNFENFDQYGAAGFDNGPGNHSVHVDGMIKLPNGTWALTMMNSWGLWGPQRDGRCLIYQRHVDGCGAADDAFAHVSAMLPDAPV